MKEINAEMHERMKVGTNFSPKYFELYRTCQSNAWDLLEEAEILAKNQRYARAYFLAFTAAVKEGRC